MTNVHAPQVTILVVENEPRSQRLFRTNLEPLGYRVLTTERANDVLQLVERHAPDLVLLDLDVPDGDGYRICQQLRVTSSVPVIFISPYDQPSYKARGLELGGDDYIVKPYDPLELAARIDAVLRRVRRQPVQHNTIFECGLLMIDFTQHRVVLEGQELQLSRTEYRLLEYFAQNVGRTIVADTLLSNVWGPHYLGEYSSLHLYISRLRRKLGEDSHNSRYIVTKPGIGYMMPADVAAPTRANVR